MGRINRKRLTIDIPTDIHNELKILAIRYNITLTIYVMRALVDKLKQEKEWNEKPVKNEKAS